MSYNAFIKLYYQSYICYPKTETFFLVPNIFYKFYGHLESVPQLLAIHILQVLKQIGGNWQLFYELQSPIRDSTRGSMRTANLLFLFFVFYLILTAMFAHHHPTQLFETFVNCFDENLHFQWNFTLVT